MLHACDLIPKPRRNGQERPPFGADDLWLLLCVTLWGGNAVASKLILLTLSPLVVFYVRLLGMALCFGIPLLLLRGRGRRRELPWGVLVVGGLFMAGQNATFFWGMRLTQASSGMVLATSAPLWTALVAGACGLESFRRRNWVGLGAAVVGVTLVIFGAPRGGGAYAPAPVLGDFLSLLSAVFFALFLLTTKRAVEELGALLVLGVSYCLGALIMLPGAFVVLPQAPWETLTTLDWSMLAYAALLAGTVAFLVYFWVVGRTGAVRAALYQYLGPIIAVLAAGIFLHEALHPVQYLGIALTLVGIYLARPPLRR